MAEADINMLDHHLVPGNCPHSGTVVECNPALNLNYRILSRIVHHNAVFHAEGRRLLNRIFDIDTTCGKILLIKG